VYYDQIPADGPFLYGSKFIYERAKNLSLPAGLRTFANTGHTLDDNKTKQDSAYKDFSAWLYTILKAPSTTSVEIHNSPVPTAMALYQNYPNPFNPTTTIEFSLPLAERISLAVYDLIGRSVMTLVDGLYEAGTHSVRLYAGSLCSGMYLFQLKSKTLTLSRKMILMR
jgi:hypothetical protein